MKFASLFSGGGGVDIGALTAGYDLAWGVELRPDIAEVANANLGQHVIAANILDLDPADFEPVDLLHASPPCPSFSTAKTGGEETDLDIALAQKTADFVVALRPTVFTLENVYAYRNSKSWQIIEQALVGQGYSVKFWHVMMADYGVPQTRARMIVVAWIDGRRPSLPEQTHAENPVPGLFGTLERWVGWYAAIEDLIPTLPESELAPWQLARLPEEMKQAFLLNTNMSGDDGAGMSVVDGERPAFTVTTGGYGRLRAALADSKNTGQEYGKLYRKNEEPDITVTAIDRPSHMPRALLVSSVDSTTRDSSQPATTIVNVGDGHSIPPRAFIVDDGNSKNGCIKSANQPMATIRTQENGGTMSRAFANGRVVKMTPRALARFQGFPDWYSFPASKKHQEATGDLLIQFADETEKNVDGRLATTIIGNAVPPLFYQRLAETVQRYAKGVNGSQSGEDA